MFAKARILLYIFIGVLTLALLWRAFLYEPPAEALPAPATPAVVVPPTAKTITESDLILDLFNPTDGMLAAQIAESTLTRQIDEALTINFLLRRCEYLSEAEYSDTYRALVAYAYRAKIAPTMAEAEQHVRGIAEAASASYALLYARTKCDAPELPIANRQLRTWRDAMLKN